MAILRNITNCDILMLCFMSYSGSPAHETFVHKPACAGCRNQKAACATFGDSGHIFEQLSWNITIKALYHVQGSEHSLQILW